MYIQVTRKIGLYLGEGDRSNLPIEESYNNPDWTAVAWYLTDQVNSKQVFKKLATLVLCYVKSLMTVDKLRTSEVD